MNDVSFLNHDPQDNNPQYLEDLAGAYRFSQVLFTGIELGVFDFLEPDGKTPAELAVFLDMNGDVNHHPKFDGLRRFLHALCALELICRNGETYFNGQLARRFLLKESDDYQGEGILRHRSLSTNWGSLTACLQKRKGVTLFEDQDDWTEKGEHFRRHSREMDCMARNKAKEMLPFFNQVFSIKELLAVGPGASAVSHAFLEIYPDARATLLSQGQASPLIQERDEGKWGERIRHCPANMPAPWPVSDGKFDLVILTNLSQSYGEEDVSLLLDQAAACLKPDGFLLIHDFFLEHFPEKAALMDLDIFLRKDTGKVLSVYRVEEKLRELGLAATEMVPLRSDSALIFGAKKPDGLAALCLDKKSQLAARMLHLGFSRASLLSPEIIHVPGWVDLHCRFGCSSFGKPHCPPNSLMPEKTREMLQDYSCCLLLEGAPPTGDFQRQVLQAEKEAFHAGFYKAFALWAGPCSLCAECGGEKGCKNTKKARPSMEASGIDVFETVKRAGISLSTLAPDDYFVKYFAILLLE